MPAIRITIHPKNPEPRKIEEVAKAILAGQTIIYPTDTVYGIGCIITQARAVERIAAIRGIKPEKAQFSIMCADLSQLSHYAANIDHPTYRLLRRALPGAYTFILKASSLVPKILAQSKKTIGIRVAAHPVSHALLAAVGSPILTASLKNDEDAYEYPTDPDEIYELFKHKVDVIVDGGAGNFNPSTIIDLTQSPPQILRAGAGPVDIID